MKRWSDSFGFAALLNIIIPGSGHLFWRDYLFGTFVLLIALLTLALFYFSLLFPLPPVVKLVLFILPALFYVSSYVDLYKAVQKKGHISKRAPRTAAFFLLFGVAAQLAIPALPGNLLLANMPSLGTVSDNGLAPLLRRGDKIVRAAATYRLNLAFVDHPVWLRRPQCGDLVSFVDDGRRGRIGIVVARSGEQAEIIDGSLWVNGVPLPDAVDPRLRLTGDMELTAAERGSILVATLKLGAIDTAYQVYGGRLLGKVYRLF